MPLNLARTGPAHPRLPRPMVFVLVTGASALVIGVPTDVIDTSFFERITPVRWWEYPVLVMTALLTAAWFVTPRPSSSNGSPGGRRVAASSVLSALAIGCPVCNKLVVTAVGVSGALGAWAPVQPFVALISLVLVALAVLARRRACARGCVAPDQRHADRPRPEPAR